MKRILSDEEDINRRVTKHARLTTQTAPLVNLPVHLILSFPNRILLLLC